LCAQTEGLIEIPPRVGTFVTTPSRREITEFFEMKELLGAQATACTTNWPNSRGR